MKTTAWTTALVVAIYKHPEDSKPLGLNDTMRLGVNPYVTLLRQDRCNVAVYISGKGKPRSREFLVNKPPYGGTFRHPVGLSKS